MPVLNDDKGWEPVPKTNTWSALHIQMTVSPNWEEGQNQE